MRKAKKRILIWVIVVTALVGVRRMVPELVRDTIPSIYYVTPTVKTYESLTQCAGTLQPVSTRQIILESAVIPQEVRVAVGERVNVGEVLAVCQPTSLAGITASLPRFALDAETVSSLMSAYGVAGLLGEAGINSGDLAAFIEQGTQNAALQTSKAGAEETGEITAPISGVVTSVGISSYLPAASGSAAFTIMDTSAYTVMASVSENDISKISLGDVAKVRGSAFSGSVYTGRVVKIYPTARKALNGTVTETVVDVEILLDRADSYLKPGFSAKVEIAGKNHYQLVCVPYEAVRQDDNNNEYVYTYEDGRLKKTTIITGRELPDEVEVLEGLTPESIVIYNPDSVDREGTMIHLRGRADAA